MRLSKIQKDIMFLLYSLELKGCDEPVPGMALLNMINNSRNLTIADRNFRVSCHTLYEHGQLNKFRAKNLKLHWSLTAAGRENAKPIYEEMINEVN